MKTTNETMSFDGATKLADTIKAYWAKRGHIVRTWLEAYKPDPDERKVFYLVRSDLVNGLPAVQPLAKAA